MNIKTMKGGDGFLPNSSFFISSSSNCLLNGIIKHLLSPLFIPQISSFNSPNDTNQNTITFHGFNLFPCSILISLASFSSDMKNKLSQIDSLLPSFLNENSFSYSLSSDDLKELNSFSFLYSSIHFFSSDIYSFMIINKLIDTEEEEDEEDEGRLSEGGITTNEKNPKQTAAVVVLSLLFSFCFVGGGIYVGLILMKKFQMKKKKEEEEIEMSIREDEKGEKEPEEFSSTTHLLSPYIEKEGISTNILDESKKKKRSDSTGRREENEENEEQEQEEENRRDEREEKREGSEIASSVDMKFLVEATSTIPPFNKILVDLRDSLGYQLRTSIMKFEKKQKEELGIEVIYSVGRAGEKILETKNGINLLNHLSPENIIFSSTENISISPVDLSSVEGGTGAIDENEWKRYSAPEMLQGEVDEATDSTIAFSLGMIAYSILSGGIVFVDFDGDSVADLILQGQRPPIENIVNEFSEWVEFVILCLSPEVDRRPKVKEIMAEMFKKSEAKRLKKEEKRIRKLNHENEEKQTV
jgi:hypothetical protein